MDNLNESSFETIEDDENSSSKVKNSSSNENRNEYIFEQL